MKINTPNMLNVINAIATFNMAITTIISYKSKILF